MTVEDLDDVPYGPLPPDEGFPVRDFASGRREGRREGGRKGGNKNEERDADVFRTYHAFIYRTHSFALPSCTPSLPPSLPPYLLSSASAGGSALRKVFNTNSSRTGLS